MNPDRIQACADELAAAYLRLHSARAAESKSPDVGTSGSQATRKAAHPAPIALHVIDTIAHIALEVDRTETLVRRDIFGLRPAMRPDPRDRAGIRNGLPAHAPDPRVFAALDWIAKASATIAARPTGGLVLAHLTRLRRRAITTLGEAARAVPVREWPCPWCSNLSLLALPESGMVVCTYTDCPCREATGQRFAHPVDEHLIVMIDEARKP